MAFYTPVTPDARSAARRGEHEASDYQPWRCAVCGEAVDPGFIKIDCACTRAARKTKARKPK
jgi:hypothetical protein